MADQPDIDVTPTTMGVYEAILKLGREGYSPSLREIASETGLSVTQAHYHVAKLRKWDWVTQEDGKPRTLRPSTPF